MPDPTETERVFYSAAEVFHHFGACRGWPECSRCENPQEKALREFGEAIEKALTTTGDSHV